MSTNLEAKSITVTGAKYALIVDDDPGILDVYQMALSDLGFEPVVSLNGEDAIAKAAVKKPSLVILDQRMPGMSGTELARKLRAAGCQNVPIIMVSAARHIQQEAFDAGATIYLEKPFDVDELISSILRYTETGNALSA